MKDAAPAVAAVFSKLLRDTPSQWMHQQRACRQLLRADPMEQFVLAKLLEESMRKQLDALPDKENPVVLFLDRSGGGEGARAAAGIFPLIGAKWPGVSFVHVSFATPTQGLGILIRNLLAQAGADNRVNVHVVAHNRPAEGIRPTAAEVAEIDQACCFVIVFAPNGSAGLFQMDRGTSEDPFLSHANVAILSYLDPEAILGELDAFGHILSDQNTMHAIRYWVQIAREGTFEDLGVSVLGPNGDAEQRLWALLDNARRYRYQVLIEPLKGDLPAGDPLLCPCRGLLEEHLSTWADIDRIVPAGSRLIAVARGNMC
ncbi:MAG: hypothetical protein QNJ97_24515 [Myxococcota bacterium]|nr:hypothetical protein [Myxococcota bacterium]